MTRQDQGKPGRSGRLAAHLVVIACGTALLVAPLAAQAPRPIWPRAAAEVSAFRLPSENTAFTLSAVGTLAGVVMPLMSREWGWGILATWCVGPSLGFLYGGCWGRGLATAVLRFGFTLAVAVAAFNDETNDSLGYAWIGGMAALAALDLATVKRAVRNRNRRRMAGRGLQLDVSPFAVPKGAGVRLRLSF
jgi:hypothetical protein